MDRWVDGILNLLVMGDSVGLAPNTWARWGVTSGTGKYKKVYTRKYNKLASHRPGSRAE